MSVNSNYKLIVGQTAPENLYISGALACSSGAAVASAGIYYAPYWYSRRNELNYNKYFVMGQGAGLIESALVTVISSGGAYIALDYWPPISGGYTIGQIRAFPPLDPGAKWPETSARIVKKLVMQVASGGKVAFLPDNGEYAINDSHFSSSVLSQTAHSLTVSGVWTFRTASRYEKNNTSIPWSSYYKNSASECMEFKGANAVYNSTGSVYDSTNSSGWWYVSSSLEINAGTVTQYYDLDRYITEGARVDRMPSAPNGKLYTQFGINGGNSAIYASGQTEYTSRTYWANPQSSGGDSGSEISSARKPLTINAVHASAGIRLISGGYVINSGGYAITPTASGSKRGLEINGQKDIAMYSMCCFPDGGKMSFYSAYIGGTATQGVYVNRPNETATAKALYDAANIATSAETTSGQTTSKEYEMTETETIISGGILTII